MPMDTAFNGVNLASYNENQIKAIILNHVVPQVMYSTLLNAASYTTDLQGQSITLAPGAEGVTVNGAKIVLADTFMSGNGVLHIIDRVIVPPTFPDNVVVPNNTPAPSTNSTTPTASSSATNARTSSSSTAQPQNKNSAESMTGLTSVLMGLFGLLVF